MGSHKSRFHDPLLEKDSETVRELIHPRAEVRGATVIDMHTAGTMRGVLGEIVRDLQRAHEKGALQRYAEGHLA